MMSNDFTLRYFVSDKTQTVPGHKHVVKMAWMVWRLVAEAQNKSLTERLINCKCFNIECHIIFETIAISRWKISPLL